MEELRRKVKTGALNVILTNEDDEEIGRGFLRQGFPEQL